MTGWASIFFVCWGLVFFQFESCSVEPFNLITQTRTRFWPVSLLVSLRKHRQPEHPQAHSKNTNSKFISVTLLPGAPLGEHLVRSTSAETQALLHSVHATRSLSCCSHRFIHGYSQLQGHLCHLQSPWPDFCFLILSSRQCLIAQPVVLHKERVKTEGGGKLFPPQLQRWLQRWNSFYKVSAELEKPGEFYHGLECHVDVFDVFRII